MSYTINVVPLGAFDFGSVSWNAALPKFPWNPWAGANIQLDTDGSHWNREGPWNDFTIDTSQAFEVEVQDIDSRPDVLDPGTYHDEGAGLQTLQTSLPGAPAGGNIVNEYEVSLTGSDGETYKLVALNVIPAGTSSPGHSWSGTLIGFTFDGAWPPEGVTLDYVLNSNQDGQSLHASNMLPICFVEGTLIETPDSERLVEDLAIGDLVMTTGGEAVAVRWIGRQQVHARVGRYAVIEKMLPVCISAGALGNDLPHSDLYVSAGHGMIVDDLVIDAGALVNGTTIRFVTVEEFRELFTYYHIETEHHDVIRANGAGSETFIDYVGRTSFDNYQEYVDLYDGDRLIEEMPRLRISSRRQLPERVAQRLGIPSFQQAVEEDFAAMMKKLAAA